MRRVDAHHRLPSRRHSASPPAGSAILELQRTVGNRAVGQLLSRSAPAGSRPHVVQRKPKPGQDKPKAGEYGLDTSASEKAYVAKAVELWRTQKTLGLKEFAEALLTHVVGDLEAHGVPEVTWTYANLGAAGLFNSELWVIQVDLTRFSANGKAKQVGDLTLDEATDAVGTLYHEARHADQDVVIIRQLLDAKVAPRDVVAQTSIRGDVVYAVKKTKFKDPLDPDEVTHATRMFDVLYGAHNQLMAFLIRNTPAFDGITVLAGANSVLADATPHVTKFLGWQSSVLQAKVDAMKKAKGLSTTEQGVLKDLDEMNTALVDLAASWKAVADKSKPQPDAAATVREDAEAVRAAVQTAYLHLESEADAFRVEAEVKTAFGAADRAWKPPKKKKAK
jgi:hypothetical protein